MSIRQYINRPLDLVITINNELRDIVSYNLRYIKHIVTHQRVCSSSDNAWYGQIYIQQGVPILLWC